MVQCVCSCLVKFKCALVLVDHVCSYVTDHVCSCVVALCARMWLNICVCIYVRLLGCLHHKSRRLSMYPTCSATLRPHPSRFVGDRKRLPSQKFPLLKQGSVIACACMS